MSSRKLEESKGRYSPVADYVNNLKGNEFQELNKDKLCKIIKIAVAEIFGTSILVGVGCGAVVAFPGKTNMHLEVALSFALAVTLAITAFGHISGALINPSLALTAMFIGKLSFPMFIVYTISECIGATLGVAAVKAISPDECITESFCVTLPNQIINVYKALLAEAFMTFCICLVLCGVLDHRNEDKSDSVALKFGASVLTLALAGGKYTGCSLNPARSFGPALLSGNWNQHWVYWLGPLVGAACAGLLYQIIFSENKPQKKSTENIVIDGSQAA